MSELPELVDSCILVDDHSSDRTIDVAKELGLQCFVHDQNYGYGRNQQTCYREALASGADVVIMLHPDYQYTPLLVTAMASMVAFGVYDVVLGSRIIGGTALRGGMPLWKYVANRFLTAFENFFLGVKLSEYHTGYRAFGREVLTRLPLLENSDDFVFDNQMLAQCVYFGFRIGEVSCPTKYFEEASSINFSRSVKYGFGVLATTLQFALQKAGVMHFRIFSAEGTAAGSGTCGVLRKRRGGGFEGVSRRPKILSCPHKTTRTLETRTFTRGTGSPGAVCGALAARVASKQHGDQRTPADPSSSPASPGGDSQFCLRYFLQLTRFASL